MNFEIEIIGKGAHGAMPSNSVDPIVCGASLVQNLQHIVSRNADPKETLVITVATFNSGNANLNISKKVDSKEISKLEEENLLLKENTKTTYKFDIIEFDVEIPARYFSQSSLKR